MKSKVKNFCSSQKKNIQVVLAIILFYTFFHIIGIGCPILFVTGIPCLACGMTRAWGAVLQFHFQDAISYHPLFFLGPLIVSAILFENRIAPKIRRCFWLITIPLLFAVYFYRLFYITSDLIYIDLKNGMIGKLYMLIFY